MRALQYLAGLAVLLLGSAEDVRADDALWPTCRGNNARGSYLDADLPADMQLLWRHTPTQPPSPAWPPPARGSYWQRLTHIVPRVVDDHTFHPVLAGDAVLFASSADDSVCCLEVATGQIRWKYTTDGPVRYAPSVAEGFAYFGSDDGHVYCVELARGQLRWKRRLAPADRRVPGNGRIISAWPVRTGLAVADGVVYVGAGLYPSQGVYVAALAAENGMPSWEQNVDYTAHGYLLIADDRLVVPTGRSTPIVLRLSDGHFLGQLPGSPGAYAVVSQEGVFSGRGNDATLSASEIGARESLVSLPAEHVCVTPSRSFFAGRGQLQAVDLRHYMRLSRELKQRQQRHDAMVERAKKSHGSKRGDGRQDADLDAAIQRSAAAIDKLHEDRAECELWAFPRSAVGCLAASKDAVVLGSKDKVELCDQQSGEVLREFALDGFATGVALSSQHLVVSTSGGVIYCFGAKSAALPDEHAAQPMRAIANTQRAESIDWTSRIDSLAEEYLAPTFGSTAGYALVAGADNVPLVMALCQQTDFTVVVVDDDLSLVEGLRDRVLDEGLYGSRCAVHAIEPGRLPLADYCVNLLISSRGVVGKPEARWSRDELLRVVRPAGGVAWLDSGTAPVIREALPGAGRWVHQYGDTGNTANSGDRLTHWDMQLQWFGGPGPARMVDRHLRAPAPLASDGRMFVSGENSIVCVDSYHGTEYWQLDAPDSQRYSMPYDCGYCSVDGDRFALAVQDAAWIVDAATGAVQKRIPAPVADNASGSYWGYLALAGEDVFGSIQKPTASRTAPSRDQIDRDYGNARPTVTGNALFRLNVDAERVSWRHDAVVLNPTIAVAHDRVYFVAATDASLHEHPTGRIGLSELLAGGVNVSALDASSGNVVWDQELNPHMALCNNVLYLQATQDFVILSGSYVRENDSWYRIAVLDAESGATVWTAEHKKNKPGEFTHGEQVHHPVVLGDRLVCEPVIYDLRTGRRIGPDGEADSWTLVRPAHSCGTMSGAGNCLFFRSGNPTVMDLSDESHGRGRFRSISPSRPGCWINIIPADGLVLIPEASASCVCHYSLQTSMAFQPVPRKAAQDR